MRRFLPTGILGLAVGAIGGALALSPLGFAIEEDLGLRLLFSLRGPSEPPSEVVVVTTARLPTQLAVASNQEIDWSHCRAAPRPVGEDRWPRCLYAHLVDKLVQAGASTIVFDVIFDKPSTAADDAELISAIARSERTVLLQHLRVEMIANSGILRETLSSPIPALTAVATGLAPFPLPKVPARVNQFWAFKSSLRDAPTLPAVALRVHALPLMEQFTELLEQAGQAHFNKLPQDSDQVITAQHLHRLMAQLRQELGRRPELIQRLLELLSRKTESGLSPHDAGLLSALVRLYSGQSSYHLNFYGPPGTISTVPADTILGAGADVAKNLDLTGKVVFVGPSDLYGAGQKDGFYTVFSREDGTDLSGVEIAASAFANLLAGSTLGRLSNLASFGLLLLFGSLVGAGAHLLSGFRGVIATLSLGALYFGAAQFLFAEHNYWIPLVIPLIFQAPVALSAGLLLQYLTAKRERENVSKAILHYIPEDVAKKLVKHGYESAETEVVHGICLSTDAEHYTTIGEALGPTELASYMNEYFEVLSQPIERHNGVVLEIVADSMMCVWRSLSETMGKDTRLEACRAALEVHQAVQRFNQSHGDQTLPTRIGLHAGRVALANVGGGRHFSYSLVGDIAITTSRIERLNKHLGTWILASEPVVTGLDEVLLRRVGSFMLEGKSTHLSIFEILGSSKNSDQSQISLCRQFGCALKLHDAGRWSEAAEAFDNLLKLHPTDGPSLFFMERSRIFSAAPPTDGQAHVIRMETK